MTHIIYISIIVILLAAFLWQRARAKFWKFLCKQRRKRELQVPIQVQVWGEAAQTEWPETIEDKL